MYSTAKDIHIGIVSKLYQLNSNRKRILRSEELDYAFNDSMLKFIEERSIVNAANVGLDETVKRQDDLKDLKISRKKVDVLTNIGNLSSPFDLDKQVFALLPNDYYKFEGLELAINYDCKREDNNIKTKVKDTLIYKLAFGTPTSTSKYDSFELVTGDGTYTTLAAKLQGLHKLESKFMIINSVLNTAKFKVYWETYLDIHEPNHFIITTTSATIPSLTMDGVTVNASIILDSYTEFDYISNKNVTTELALSKEIADIRNNYYAYRNRYKKPLIELERNRLRIDYNSKYLPIKGFLTYIKKPILINLKGDVMTDFTSHINEIIDMAVLQLQLTFEGRDGLVAAVSKNVQ